MNTIEDFARAYRNAMPEQLSGTVNLMAHPLAGMAAASALGLGVAGHAFGMWAGAVAGAAEASQRLFADLAPARRLAAGGAAARGESAGEAACG
jgi:NADH-quinone oxidoreductase subunit E